HLFAADLWQPDFSPFLSRVRQYDLLAPEHAFQSRAVSRHALSNDDFVQPVAALENISRHFAPSLITQKMNQAFQGQPVPENPISVTLLPSNATKRRHRFTRATGPALCVGSRLLSRLSVESCGPAIDQVLQLILIRGARHSQLERNQFPEIQACQRLIESLHSELLLTGLHHRIVLMNFVLAYQVSDGRIRHEYLHSQHAPLPIRPWQ